MFVTLNKLIVDVQTRISVVPGVGVQLYGEDSIASMILEGFYTCVDEEWWTHLMGWKQVGIDGVTGTITNDLVDNLTTLGIHSFSDIRSVWYGDSRQVIPELPGTINPFQLSGTFPTYISGTGDPARPIQVWPPQAIGPIYILGKIYRSRYVGNDIVPFDKIALVNYAAWKYTTDDGANPNQISSFERSYMIRMQQLKIQHNNKPQVLVPQGTNRDSWTVEN